MSYIAYHILFILVPPHSIHRGLGVDLCDIMLLYSELYSAATYNSLVEDSVRRLLMLRTPVYK